MTQYSHANDAADTIVAIATPPGTAGIAIVRVSGSEAITMVHGVFDGADLTQAVTHTVHHGRVVDADGAMIDEVLATIFRAPRSYTGEDSVEIGCHGGAAVTRGVLHRLLAVGARHAAPGEFTRRAFLNGRIDLVQAEAVADLIHAESRNAHQASLRQLDGSLSAFVRGIRERLLEAAAMLELNLDFVEEDVAFLAPAELQVLMQDAENGIQDALLSYDSGRLLREGVRVALVGPPNVGKSSLLNRMLGTARAIVTDVPGTTRDFIEEPLLINGEMFRFIDTAGLRRTEDAIEREGIARTRDRAEDADVICVLGEAADGPAAVEEIIAELSPPRPGQRVLRVFTKCDLSQASDVAALSAAGIPISSVDGSGLDRFRDALTDFARHTGIASEQGTVLVTNVRHADCLRRGRDALGRARQALAEGATEEFVAVDIRDAITALGEIIGEVTSDDILNGIFARFCIGK